MSQTPHNLPSTRADDDHAEKQSLFEVPLEFDREQEYVEAEDGRKIPFAILSSGQQELLPLWMAIESFIGDLEERNLVFIEEPESAFYFHLRSLF